MRFNLRSIMAWIAILAVVFGGIAWAMKLTSFAEFYWFGSQAIRIGIYLFPWFCVVAAFGLLVALVALISDKRTWRIRSLWILLPFVVPILILWFGIVFRDPPRDGGMVRRHAPVVFEHRTRIVESLVWLHAPIGIGLLACFRSKSNWLAVIGLSVTACWFSWGSSVMSWMSVTNIWL